MLFRIWENEYDGSISLSPEGSRDDIQNRMESILYRLGFLEERVAKVAEFQARTQLEAAQKRNKIMGWEEYHPARDENGNIYPEYLEDLDKKSK